MKAIVFAKPVKLNLQECSYAPDILQNPTIFTPLNRLHR